MQLNTFIHTLPSGERAKFTIRDRTIGGELFFYANVIDTELESYVNLSDVEKESRIGIEITNGRQQSVNYSDKDRLINDIKTVYGHGQNWLESEI